ncbi:histo-blood group ABO system transferase [Mesoplodon densirostris]|uniref:histo-blood group ABO system transferase n=1 Tax=Mesoplodon densirostris TaxID=48708 RepID=UPI0028DB6A24|nr:histo-blood group ABO system transferase [Mesoplodon densirostris]
MEVGEEKRASSLQDDGASDLQSVPGAMDPRAFPAALEPEVQSQPWRGQQEQRRCGELSLHVSGLVLGRDAAGSQGGRSTSACPLSPALSFLYLSGPQRREPAVSEGFPPAVKTAWSKSLPGAWTQPVPVWVIWGPGKLTPSDLGFLSTEFWGKSTKFWLGPILLFAVFLGFYSNVFSLISTWQREQSQSSPEVHHLQGQQGPLSTLFSSLSEGDRHLDTCRIPEVPRLVYPKAQLLKPTRVDVLVMTPWFAPIIWDGTFDSAILDAQFRNITIGLTVFAIKKYVVFLKLFLETAEKYFMVGHKVNYYVFTDRPADVPQIPLQEGRQVVVLKVRNYKRWQDISMHRMEMISNFSQQRFLREVHYLVCLDVDMKFSDHVGVEILAPLFGTLHPGFYAGDRQSFTYERRPLSQAYIPRDEGDFYYMGSFFGGSVPEVYQLTTACHQVMMADQANGIEAVWHDESHLNRYLLYHKPSKVLSPEYMWDEQLLRRPPFLRKLRFVAVPKNHAEIRNQ